MTQLWMDGFDHYGSDTDNMLNGAWDALGGSVQLAVPPGGARTGPMCLFLNVISSNARRALGTVTDTLIVGEAFYTAALPEDNNIQKPMIFKTATNVVVCYLTVRPDGAIEARDVSATVIGVTTGPVINAGSWQHIEMKAFRDNVVGTIEVRVDEITVLTLTGLSLGITDFGIFEMDNDGGFTDPNHAYIDDLVVRDDQGTVNNDFEGDLRVATLQPVANGANQGWATRSLEKLDIGVLNVVDVERDASIMFDDDPVFEIGAGDFCIEGFVRFNSLLVLSQEAMIFSKWREDTNECSWRLKLTGPDSGNNLEFSTSNLGTLADEVIVHTYPFVPLTNRWYHVAVTREGTASRMYIDGVQVGGNQVDSRAYYDGAADVVINGQQNAAATIFADSGVDGWMDGVRLTVGQARYIAAVFALPTEALPDDVGGDPLYASVELLLNFDDVSNPDQSANSFVGSLKGGAALEFPDDTDAYETIDGETPTDFDFVEAELVAATGILTLTGQPLNTETVTLGLVTYTFQTVLTAVANNVLIGADASESLDNLLAAVNQELGEGTIYGAGTVFNIDAYMAVLPGDLLLATARVAGAAGNSLATTETLTNGSWAAATLLGGLDIPTNSEFTMGNLPADVTGINALAVITRSFKTDTGTSELTASFVKDGGFAAAGAARALPTSPTYFEDTHETDPETAGPLTPSTMVNSRIRLDRTA